jgi:hypothetical protein
MRQTYGFSHRAGSRNESADSGCSFPYPKIWAKWKYNRGNLSIKLPLILGATTQFTRDCYDETMRLLYILFIVVVVVLILLRIGRRSGVSRADLVRRLPGDDIVPRPGFITDHATDLNAPVEMVWPWIIQLGKQRAGWYAPLWLERLLVWKPAKRGVRSILPQFQQPRVDDIVPDWGPGSFQILQIDPNRAIVYGSVHGKPPTLQHDNFLFSWALTLRPTDAGHTRLHIRLRGRPSKNPLARIFLPLFGGLIDYLTIAAMFAGLKQRLHSSNKLAK